MSTCQPRPGTLDVIAGFFLIFGTIISFLPQYYKIIKNKSTLGISHWTQGLNNISGFCAFFGSFMLDYHLFLCCKTNGHCINYIIPFLQLAFNWLCPFIGYVIFIKYFTSTKKKEKKLVYGFFGMYLVVFVGCVTMTCIVLIANWKSWKKHGILFGDILNGLSAILTIIIWVPQLLKTHRLKTIGSLSLWSLAIQAPGAFVVFIFQVIVNKSSWFIGVPYLIICIFQICLLIMGIHYERKKNRVRFNHVDAVFSYQGLDTEDDDIYDEDADLVSPVTDYQSF